MNLSRRPAASWTDTLQVCEGDVSLVLPPCCCQTLQPALLPAVYTTQFSISVRSIWSIFINTHIYYYLCIAIHCHTLQLHVNFVQNCVHMYIGVYSISYLLIILLIFFTIIVLLKYYCPLAALADKLPHLWDNKGILILIILLE